jgi:hypothetical protein
MWCRKPGAKVEGILVVSRGYVPKSLLNIKSVRVFCTLDMHFSTGLTIYCSFATRMEAVWHLYVLKKVNMQLSG